jgi:AcrR family transcriptional regulator
MHMSRPKSIDRGLVLDAAERIVADQGASHLTFEAVSREVGVTKGGIQSCFGTKEGLVTAMLKRWGENYDDAVWQLPGSSGPFKDAKDHVRLTAVSHDLNARSASLLAALVQSKEQVAFARDWYARHTQGFDLQTEEGRRARVAFFATEGIFLLRYLGLADVSQAEWDGFFKDVDNVLLK